MLDISTRTQKLFEVCSLPVHLPYDEVNGLLVTNANRMDEFGSLALAAACQSIAVGGISVDKFQSFIFPDIPLGLVPTLGCRPPWD